MPRFAHLSHAALAAALAIPVTARAGDDPPATAAAAAVAPAPKPRDHRHFGRVARGLVPCEKCAAQAKAAQAAAMAPPVQTVEVIAAPRGRAGHNHGPIPTAGMPEGSRIVGCAHSSNGVCATCKALLELPGEVVAVAPGMAPTAAVASAAPGRAVASDAEPGHALVAAGEPEPIGVMRTNYSASAPAGAAARPAQPAMPATPGSGPSLGPQHDSHDPHVIGHLFGFSAIHRDIQDKWGEKEKKKREKHAAISYDSADGKVQDLPAAMVYGRGAPR